MKKFSVLSMVVALFAATTAFGQEQASPSDAPAAAAVETVQPQAASKGVVQAAEGSVVQGSIMPMENQIGVQNTTVMGNTVMSNGCCGSVQPMTVYQPQVVNQPVVSQPCCGQVATAAPVQAAPMMSNCCGTAPTRIFRVRRPVLRRVRGNCCN